MTFRDSCSYAAGTAVLALCACGGGGNAAISTPSGQAAQSGAGYVPQSTQAGIAQTTALAKPLPDALISLGKPANSPNLTAPIINDSGSYTNGPIILGTNTTTGYGVEGIADGSGAGVYGHSSYTGSGTSYGVYGYSANGSGVYGYSGTYGRGVFGVSVNGEGVEGETSFPSNSSPTGTYDRAGVLGEDLSTDGGEYDAGVAGTTVNGYGVYGQASGNGAGSGIQGIATNRGTAIDGYVPGTATGGVGISAGNDGPKGMFTNGVGLYAESRHSVAIEAEGIASSTSTPVELLYSDAGQPFIIGNNDSSGSADEFSIDANGNMILRGNLTVDGTISTANYATCSSCTAPLIAHRAPVEVTGEGQMSGGRGFVRLDPAYAAQLDTAEHYNVFLTPYSDSKGLFVTDRTPSGFTVRENQGGTASLAFGYRVVGIAKQSQVATPIRDDSMPPHHVVRRFAASGLHP